MWWCEKVLIVGIFVNSLLAENVSQNINFIVYNPNGEVHNNSFSDESFERYQCSVKDKISFILPGWLENCNSTEWIPDLIQNLHNYRGGCVICVDYNYYSKQTDYFSLVLKVDSISKTFFDKYIQWQNYGFDPENVFFFGFSFGGHVALNAGRAVNELHNGSYLINRIDVCELASPGFLTIKDSKVAADNVQCIHTSGNYGTTTRNCHQNWNMGLCGIYQPAHGPYPKGSHGLCPYFYNSAFNNTFFAITKPPACPSTTRAVSDWPSGFRMGYIENRFKDLEGDFYAETTATYPYNKIELPDMTKAS